jgi:hypothetical protein
MPKAAFNMMTMCEDKLKGNRVHRVVPKVFPSLPPARPPARPPSVRPSVPPSLPPARPRARALSLFPTVAHKHFCCVRTRAHTH